VDVFAVTDKVQPKQLGPPSEPPVAPWRANTRIAFRFSFAYLALFSLATQILGSLVLIPNVSFRGFGWLWPMRDITFWFGKGLFHIHTPLVYDGNSRDSDFYWVQAFWILLTAAIATLIWTGLDRRRTDYVTLNKWSRLFVRFALAAQMFEYGMTKVIPTQFPSPSLNSLVTPLGNLSLQGLLWTSVGASSGYEIFTGCAELLAGILLIVPRTAMLGALICLADMIQVFVLNMTYDIGVKLISFHIILLTFFFLAPESRRLANFFFLGTAIEPATAPPLFRDLRRSRIALAAQILFGIYLLGMQADVNWVYWYAEGGGRTRSPLYGIWNVEELSVDGQTRPAALHDYDRRWRRVIFDSPESLAFQRTDDSFARYGVSVDAYRKTLALTKGQSKIWKSNFTFQRPTAEQLVLDGQMDGHSIHMQLQLAEFDTFRLLNSTFRWVRPPD
jgi:hypothetical protein